MRSAGGIGLLMLGALPGTALAAPVVKPVSVSRTVVVPAGAARSAILNCPGTAVALNGAASAPADSVPGADAQRWIFRFAAQGAERRVRTVLRCVRLNLPDEVDAVRLVVGTVRRPLTLDAGADRAVTLRCRRGQEPTGWGVERGDAGDAIAVTAVTSTRRAVGFVLENQGATAATATPRIRCLERTQDGGSGLTHSFRLRRPSFEDSGRSARHSCRQGEYSVSAGAVVDGAVLEAAIPRGPRSARWRFSSAAGATTGLICLSRRTRFR